MPPLPKAAGQDAPSVHEGPQLKAGPKGAQQGKAPRGCRGHSLLCVLLSPGFAFGLDEDLGERGRK